MTPRAQTHRDTLASAAPRSIAEWLIVLLMAMFVILAVAAGSDGPVAVPQARVVER